MCFISQKLHILFPSRKIISWPVVRSPDGLSNKQPHCLHVILPRNKKWFKSSFSRDLHSKVKVSFAFLQKFLKLFHDGLKASHIPENYSTILLFLLPVPAVKDSGTYAVIHGIPPVQTETILLPISKKPKPSCLIQTFCTESTVLSSAAFKSYLIS